MVQRNLLIVAVLGMLPVSLAVIATVTTSIPILQNAYAEGNEDEDTDGQSETNSEREEEDECNISGVFNTCVVGDAPTGAVQTTQDQSETPMILALPT
jgi:hypothetical protein